MRQGGQLARAAQLPGDAAQGGDTLLRLKLVGHRPTGELVREAHLLPQRQVAHLDHHAVDQEIQSAALLLNFPDALLDFLPVVGPAQVGADGEAVLPQKIQHPRLGRIGRVLDGAHLIKERVKPPRRGHRRIQIAQGSGGGVAGVLQRLPGRFVVFLQGGKAHDALALHLQQPLVGDAQRHGAHRPGLGQDGLSRDAVAAGGRLYQLTIPVGQVQRQTVELVFHIVLQLRLAGQPLRAADPVLQRADGLHLVHAPQLGDMPVGLEARQGFTAHPVRGRVRQDDAALLLQCGQLIVHFVPLLVGNDGLVQHIVGVSRLVQPVHQGTHQGCVIGHASSSSLTMGAMDRLNSFTPYAVNSI